MTDLDDAFVEAAAQSAFEIDHRGTDVLLRAPEREETFAAPAGDDEATPFTLDGGRDDVVLEVVVDGEVVGLVVPVDDGFGVLIVPEDGEEPSGELETLEEALDELGI
ncbi:hypothetical protein [Schumannella soli]|uniref:Uncharacterized protein n=1 Tax=Schumannella soli TaxID=2590779 RepID=A0A506Y793_9MICO|nr:hypothetical protein [Schumannella soli]TPW77895.1 hypothetical protein FJ657_04440 [Schumannella soli]